MVSRAVYAVPIPGGRVLRLGERTCVMGVLNVTPDSFADGGRWLDPSLAADAALAMEAAGADIIDVGAESTRPGADEVPVAEELRRILPVLDRLAERLRIPISVDTCKAAVAAAALERGAAIVNDISALRYDGALAGVVATHRAALVLMHHRGRAREMYRDAHYGDVAADVREELRARVDVAVAAGVTRDRLIVDPGIGFAKQAGHSLELLARLDEIHALGCPVLVGPSRKSFLTAALGSRPPGERDWGTAAAVATAAWLGAHIVRVHDVPAMVDVVRTVDALRRARGV